MRIAFFVPGLPVAQGSKRHVGGGIMVESNKATLLPWRQAVAAKAQDAASERVLSGPLAINTTFQFMRPQNHYGTGRNAAQLKPQAPIFRVSAPDLDKLCRALFDGLVISGVIRDDSLIASLHAQKTYDDRPGVKVELWEL